MAVHSVRSGSWFLLSMAVWGCQRPNASKTSVEQDAGSSNVIVDAGFQSADAGVVSTETPSGCTRAETVRTADIALFDMLKNDLASLSSTQERENRVDAFVAQVEASGGTPLVGRDGNRVLFFAKGHPVSGYSVAGSWNNWTARQDLLTSVDGTSLYVAELSLLRTQAYFYKLVDGEHWFEDHRSQHAVWDGINRNTVGEFNGVVYPHLQDGSKGRLVAWRYFPSMELQDARDVFIYVPQAYDTAECRALPTLYFADGNESLTRVPFQAAADETYAKDETQAALQVYVALPKQEVRMSQYTFGPNTQGDAYLAFLKKELIPAVEAAFRTCPTAENRGIAGASLGGLISTYAAFQMPDVFGFVGAQSASFFWQDNAMVKRAGEDPVLPLRFYIDHGAPSDNGEVSQLMVNALVGKGYAVRHVQDETASHDWYFWQQRLPGLLSYFREGQPKCGAASR